MYARIKFGAFLCGDNLILHSVKVEPRVGAARSRGELCSFVELDFDSRLIRGLVRALCTPIGVDFRFRIEQTSGGGSAGNVRAVVVQRPDGVHEALAAGVRGESALRGNSPYPSIVFRHNRSILAVKVARKKENEILARSVVL